MNDRKAKTPGEVAVRMMSERKTSGRKTTIPFIIVLAAVLAVSGLLTGCSENQGVRLRYQAEQMYFEVERQARASQIKPELNPENIVGQLRDQYGSVVEFCYAAMDSITARQYPVEHQELALLTFRSSARLSQMFYADKEYDTCVVIFERLLGRVPIRGLALVNSFLNLGQALQASGKWDSALTVYEYAVDNFYPPADAEGEVILNLFNLPAHIYGVYDRLKDSASADLYLANAETYYNSLVQDYPRSQLATTSRASLTNLYEITNRWDMAVAQLGMIRDSSGAVPLRVRQRIADINARYLGRRDLALEQYDAILNDLEGRDTVYKPLVLFKKAIVLLEERRPADARAELVDIKHRYERFYNANPAVQGSIAKSWEDEQRWDRADTEFRYLVERFAGSEQAMSTYLYLVSEYRKRGYTIEAERMEIRAEAEFDRVAASQAGTILEASALGHKAELYRRRADWPRVAAILTEIFDKFPKSEIGYQSLVGASVVHREKLNDPVTADSLLAQLKIRLTAVDGEPEI